MNSMYYVYLIKSINFKEQVYIGCTKDLKRRFQEHNLGNSPFTDKFKPWELVFYMAFKDSTKATEFEKYLKSGSGRAFLKKRLI